MEAYPELSGKRLFEEVQAAGYAGGYDQVRRYVREVRPRPPQEPVQRFETPPGHQGQVDFAEFRTPWGKRHALVVVLGYSRLMWVRYYERQTMAVVMRGLESAFTYFGGVPSELLFDQMKAVVVEDNREVGGRLMENPEFLRFAFHWGFRIRACRPYRAQTKGKVERPVSYIRRELLLRTRLRIGRRSERAGAAVARHGGQRPRPRHAEGASGRPVRGGATASKAPGPLALPFGGAQAPRAVGAAGRSGGAPTVRRSGAPSARRVRPDRGGCGVRPPSRRERIAAQLADLKMPGTLEALDSVLAGVDGGQTTAARGDRAVDGRPDRASQRPTPRGRHALQPPAVREDAGGLRLLLPALGQA